jgi:hypothetical protein
MLVGACAPHTENIGKLSPEIRAQIDKIQIYDAAQLVHMSYTVIDPLVQGVSCKHMVWSSGSKTTAALEQVRYLAWKEGANGLTNVKFSSGGGGDCWNSVVASAEALRVNQQVGQATP